ncbi:hypothetical protein PVAP13_5KG774400 [Panicum virgatum]|uniref:Uncharacterized protein n=1 Tax=Panicum virgatum TaxID=38727 RepID=A0A8T0T2I4_PANVG|nr:hypothetical protein PVAP13_5KG774400 [Panicum virgatum]KAG2603476.1 hypothetical protein PVAP13_5KG774400 [Panicum virgatum]
MEMEMRRCGGLGVLCLLCAGVLAACLLPQPADGMWQGNPGRHDGTLPPPPTAGADLPPTHPAPHFGFPLQPTLGSAAPPPTFAAAGEGYPFIGSNPTVPLPTGMTDTATVLPLPDKVVGLATTVRVHVSMIGLAVIFAVVFLTTSCCCCC